MYPPIPWRQGVPNSPPLRLRGRVRPDGAVFQGIEPPLISNPARKKRRIRKTWLLRPIRIDAKGAFSFYKCLRQLGLPPGASREPLMVEYYQIADLQTFSPKREIFATSRRFPIMNCRWT